MEQIENYEGLLIGLGISSVVLFLGTVILIPLIIAYLPSDCFTRTIKPFRQLNPLHMFGRVAKNLIGTLFLLSGFIMLFIPGQGILTTILGLSLIDFPGKRGLVTS
ncbi:MAG: PGPGW domain-containing protein [Verrucomicrobiota bacterium]|nr:PGPGW domain-containing protein [Verrucomicrobiota bacterium]